jgi:hypothetical protein
MKQTQISNSHSITQMQTGLQPLMPLLIAKTKAELRENGPSDAAQQQVATLLAMKALSEFNPYTVFSLQSPQPTAEDKKQVSNAQNVRWLASSEIVAEHINNDKAHTAITSGIATLKKAIAHAQTRDGVSPEALRADVEAYRQGMGPTVEDTIGRMQTEIAREDAAAARTAEAQVGYAAQRAKAAEKQQKQDQEKRNRERAAIDKIAASREAERLAARREHAAALDAKARRLAETDQGSGTYTQRIAAAGAPDVVGGQAQKGRTP